MAIPLVLAVNNFVHDFASGMWVASIVVIYIMRRKGREVQKEVSRSFMDLVKLFAFILLASIAVIILTGPARIIAYNTYMGPTVTYTSALVTKHVILISLAVLSVAYVWIIIKKWRNELEELS